MTKALTVQQTADVRPTRGQPAASWFFPALSMFVVLGVLFRVLYSVIWEWGAALQGDPEWFEQTAASLSRGDGLAAPFLGKGAPVPTALHPPVFSTLLAILDLVRLQSVDAHRIALAFVSAATIVAMALVGRRLMGPATGLVAAAFAALSPLWVQWGGRLLSESVYLVIIPVLLWIALECVDRPRWRVFGGAGVAIGFAVLTRSEALWFAVLLGLPLVFMGSHEWKRRVRYGMILLAGVVVVVGPWVVRNDLQLGALTLSTNSGSTWVGAYTPNTFSPGNPEYGSFDDETQFADAAVLLKWGKPPGHAKAWTELTLNNALGTLGKTFARQHLSDLPGVILAREGRMWGVYSTGTQLTNDSEEGGQVRGFYIAGWFVEWISIPLTLAGAIVLGGISRRHLVILIVPLLVAVLDAAVFFGSTRLRVVAEPSMFLLSSIAIVTAARRVRTRWGDRALSVHQVNA
jgi:4-amino-4-deoxy-L-arabinose transferase-like glycosyltransferase